MVDLWNTSYFRKWTSSEVKFSGWKVWYLNFEVQVIPQYFSNFKEVTQPQKLKITSERTESKAGLVTITSVFINTVLQWSDILKWSFTTINTYCYYIPDFYYLKKYKSLFEKEHRRSSWQPRISFISGLESGQLFTFRTSIRWFRNWVFLTAFVECFVR